jgi:S1-C subfamily serine protease
MRSPLVWIFCASTVLLLTTTTPAFAYWDDVHYYLTYYIARTVGYTPEQAQRAAAADLTVDYCATTEPTQMSAMDYLAGAREDAPEKPAPRWEFHAFRNGTQFPGAVGNDPKGPDADKAISKQLDALWAVATSETNVNPGAYLHFVQDLGPHYGFGSAFGHYFNPADPVGSTLKARQAGLSIGGTVDWLGSRTYSPYKDVATMTATSLTQFLSLMSPRREVRQWDQGRLDALVAALEQANDYPPPLQSDELALYTAYVKSRFGAATAPTLTPEQQARFAKHSNGPDLNAAALEVAKAMQAAGMMETSVKSHLEARKQFTSDANGNVTPGQLDQYVLTGKLKVIVPATGARNEPLVGVVIRAPPAFWNDYDYILNPGAGNNPLPYSVTYENIPVGDVTVDVQTPVGDVLATQVVKVDKRWNEVTLRVAPGEQAAPPEDKQPAWVLRPGFPKAHGREPTANEYSRQTYTLSETGGSTHSISVPGNSIQDDFDQVYQWTISGSPPKVLRAGDRFSLSVAGTRAGQKSSRIGFGDSLSIRTEGLVDPQTGEPLDTWRTSTYVAIQEEPGPPGCSAVYNLTLPENPAADPRLEWSISAGSAEYQWEFRLLTPQEAQTLAQGADSPPPPPTGGGTAAGAPGSAQDPTAPPPSPSSGQPSSPGAGGDTTPPGPSPAPSGPRLGLNARTVKGEDGRPYVVVHIVAPRSPLAGLVQPGDILLTVDGAAVVRARDVPGILVGKQPGDAVAVVVRRGDQTVTVTATLVAPRPGATPGEP